MSEGFGTASDESLVTYKKQHKVLLIKILITKSTELTYKSIKLLSDDTALSNHPFLFAYFKMILPFLFKDLKRHLATFTVNKMPIVLSFNCSSLKILRYPF